MDAARGAGLHPALGEGETRSRTDARLGGALAEDREWFIQKAIGWQLRELSKRDPSRVRRFLAEHSGTLAGVASREATKFLKA